MVAGTWRPRMTVRRSERMMRVNDLGHVYSKHRLLLTSSVAAIVVFGLSGFSLVPQSNPPRPVQHAAQTAPAKSNAPRMLENGAPFSFADLVERVSPAVVTVTVEQQMKPQNFNPDELPEPFRDFFDQFGGGGRRGYQTPRKAV